MSESLKIQAGEFVCEGCGYFTSQSRLYARHLLTAKHQRMLSGCEKGKKTYICTCCDFTTSHSNNYDIHLTTAKHVRMLEQLKTRTESLKNGKQVNEERYICNCGKEYMYKQGLQKHKKTCSYQENKMDPPLDNILTPANMMELIVNIVKSNADIKQLMVEQMKQHMETEKRQLEHHMETEKRFFELAKEPRDNHSVNHSNNSFNLNFFLNETCKDAINVSEFIENIKIEFSDVENVGKKGYVTGITDMIVRNLSDLGIKKRPIHCTDIKRETIYIKDNDKWDKDTETKEKFQHVLNQIYNKNWNKLRSWVQETPEIRTLDSRENKLYHKILEQTDCMRGLDKLPDTNEKIIRKLSETIKVDK